MHTNIYIPMMFSMSILQISMSVLITMAHVLMSVSIWKVVIIVTVLLDMPLNLTSMIVKVNINSYMLSGCLSREREKHVHVKVRKTCMIYGLKTYPLPKYQQ